MLAVFFGGVIGTLLRAGVAQLVMDPVMPWPTLLVNLVGSFGLGLLAGSLAKRPDALLGAFIGTGVFGALTTFSAFAVEAVEVGDASGVAAALAYVGASVMVGLWVAITGYRWGSR